MMMPARRQDPANWKTILKSDDSCISNPKSEISNRTGFSGGVVQFEISDFGFEMQESSDFKIVFPEQHLRKMLVILTLTALTFLLTPQSLDAQCALCVTALENSPEGRAMAASFNKGILLLLAAPYAIFGTFGAIIYRAHRRKKLEAQRANPYIPKQ